MSNVKDTLAKWDAADELLAEKIEKCVTKDEWTTIKKEFTQTAANTLEYTGITIEVPLGKVALITVINQYNNSKPVKVALVMGGTTSDNISDEYRTYASGVMVCSMIYSPIQSGTGGVDVWTAHAAANVNDIMVKYKFI